MVFNNSSILTMIISAILVIVNLKVTQVASNMSFAGFDSE